MKVPFLGFIVGMMGFKNLHESTLVGVSMRVFLERFNAECRVMIQAK